MIKQEETTMYGNYITKFIHEVQLMLEQSVYTMYQNYSFGIQFRHTVYIIVLGYSLDIPRLHYIFGIQFSHTVYSNLPCIMYFVKTEKY